MRVDQQTMYNTMSLYDHLNIYGVDRNNTKEDLMLLSIIADIFNLDNNYKLLDAKKFNMLMSKVRCIITNNPVLKRYRCKDDCSNDDLNLLLSLIITEDSSFGFVTEDGNNWLVVE